MIGAIAGLCGLIAFVVGADTDDAVVGVLSKPVSENRFPWHPKAITIQAGAKYPEGVITPQDRRFEVVGGPSGLLGSGLDTVSDLAGPENRPSRVFGRVREWPGVSVGVGSVGASVANLDFECRGLAGVFQHQLHRAFPGGFDSYGLTGINSNVCPQLSFGTNTGLLKRTGGKAVGATGGARGKARLDGHGVGSAESEPNQNDRDYCRYRHHPLRCGIAEDGPPWRWWLLPFAVLIAAISALLSGLSINTPRRSLAILIGGLCLSISMVLAVAV